MEVALYVLKKDDLYHGNLFRKSIEAHGQNRYDYSYAKKSIKEPNQKLQ